MTRVLVVGGTGTTGSRVAASLPDARIASRNPAAGIRFDWSEPATYGPAVAGMDAVYLVGPVGVAEPAPLVEPFLVEAVRAGVRRVVLLSSSAVADGTAGMSALPPLVRRMVPEWTVLRPSWFMQNFVGAHMLAAGVRDRGEIVTATGSGRVPFVDADDIAAVAVRALLDAVPHNTDHMITGPGALSYGEAADVITEVTGRPVRHRSVSAADLVDGLVNAGLSAEFAAFLAGLDEDIRRGSEDRVTTAVADVTGRAPRSFAEFVAAHPASVFVRPDVVTGS